MNLSKLILLFVAFSLMAAGPAQAALPAMPEIPLTLPDNVRDHLITLRASLAQRKLALIDEGKAINAECGNVEDGSPKHQACLERRKAFNGKVEALKVDMAALALVIDDTIAADAKRVVALHADPAVVDARVPREGAYLTAQVPELARSPAAERITKGFQGVIAHDWPVALVWWQEALQRDPGNAALQRSVELAQSMVDRGKAIAGGTVAPINAAIDAAIRGENSEAVRIFEQVRSANPARAKLFHGMIWDTMIGELKQRAERTAAEKAISTDLVRQSVLWVGKLNDDGLNFLSIGMEKEAENAFMEAEFFSMGLRPDQIRSYDSPSWGTTRPASPSQAPSKSTNTPATPCSP